MLTLCCMTVASTMSGLTVGLACVDKNLLVGLLKLTIENAETPEERERIIFEKYRAKQMLKVLSDRHLLLVTLILFNSIANEALPLVLDQVFSQLVACMVSVSLVIFVSEILPITLFTGPRQVEMVSFLVPLVRFLLTICYPITKPVALLLDQLVEAEDVGDLAAEVDTEHYDPTKKRQTETDIGRARRGSLSSSDLENYKKNDNNTPAEEAYVTKIEDEQVRWKIYVRSPKIDGLKKLEVLRNMELLHSEYIVEDESKIGWISTQILQKKMEEDDSLLIKDIGYEQIPFIEEEVEDSPDVFSVLKLIVEKNSPFCVLRSQGKHYMGYVSKDHLLSQICKLSSRVKVQELSKPIEKEPELSSIRGIRDCYRQRHSSMFGKESHLQSNPLLRGPPGDAREFEISSIKENVARIKRV